MVDSGLSVEQFGTAVHRLNAVKYFQLAAFVVLVYDHALTLDQEVARIWKRPLSGASILFYINRYITPLQFIIIINGAFKSTFSTCNVLVVVI
ncbi:hypothetical protein CC2G_011080 [Coprinopsis cinerea AmutBmut pab1-1]|nr:hypothetical protein CC2G_011080 [Coprinopsis cinerea AmutBmut pab1-1]